MIKSMTIKELYENVRDGKIISDIDLQREIIYNTEKQELVIDSIVLGIPLPAFYFWKNENNILEVLDGKQRIESIKRFIENDIMYKEKLWKQTDLKLQEIINRTELSVIIVSGEEHLKREIFRRINTLGVPLSTYEVLNGLYNGEYLRGLTQYVSQDKDVIRILNSNNRGKNQIRILKYLMQLKNIENLNDYIKVNQNLSFAVDQREISKYVRFVSEIFDSFNELDIKFYMSFKYIKDLNIWKVNKDKINSKLYKYLNSNDSKITNKTKEFEDIIQAIVNNISVDEKRLFSLDDKKELIRLIYPNSQKDLFNCQICNNEFDQDELTVDHKMPWSKGGRTVLSNAQLLCRSCNSKKGNN